MKEKNALVARLINIVLAGGKIIIRSFSNSAAVIAKGIHSRWIFFSSAVSHLEIKISQNGRSKLHTAIINLRF